HTAPPAIASLSLHDALPIYLVNQDRVCTPLEVKGGKATGMPQCQKVAADEVAHLTIKEPIVQRGPKATFAATASGKTLVVTKGRSEEHTSELQSLTNLVCRL